MNKSSLIIVGVVALVLIGGIIFYANENVSPESKIDTLTSNNSANTNKPIVTATVQPRQAGSPLVITNTNSSPSDNTAIVNGSVNPNGALTSYWYEYGITSDFNNKSSSPTQIIGSGFNTIPTPGYIIGLSKNTTYYFRLVAENSYGRITSTQFSFKTTLNNPAPIGSAPTAKTVDANDISRTTVNLNGEVTPNMASTQYWFEYGKTKDLNSTTKFESVGSGTAKLFTSISLSSLTPATTYYFRIYAQNQFGTVNGSILNFKTSGPPTATAPNVITQNTTNVGTSTATFNGTINTNSAETMYWFEYSKDSRFSSGSTLLTQQKSIGSGSITSTVGTNVSNLNPKTTYYLRLVAKNSAGVNRGDKETFKTK